MGPRKSIAVIGEGITEKYYIESLLSFTPCGFKIEPKSLGLKASNLKALEKAIVAAKDKGYDEIYCLIDMDTKLAGESKTKYLTLKKKYHDKTIIVKKADIHCTIKFIETCRCTELWFLYHFQYSTRFFLSYNEVQNELRKYLPEYEKTEKYFKSAGSLDHKMSKSGGSRYKAISNAIKSIQYKADNGNCECSYSEMHTLLKALGID